MSPPAGSLQSFQRGCLGRCSVSFPEGHMVLLGEEASRLSLLIAREEGPSGSMKRRG